MSDQASQTSKIELLDPEDATGDTARYFEATREFLGRIPNSALALANTPYIARFYLPFNATLQPRGHGRAPDVQDKGDRRLEDEFREFLRLLNRAQHGAWSSDGNHG